MNKQMNVFLAELVVEYHKLQNFHWYIQGKDFYPIHAQLEKYYDMVRDFIDETAEQMLMNDATPVATLTEMLAISEIKEVPGVYRNSDDILKMVMHDFMHLQGRVVALKELADDQKIYAISAQMDEYLGDFSKAIWMLTQSGIK